MESPSARVNARRTDVLSTQLTPTGRWADTGTADTTAVNMVRSIFISI